MGSNTEKRDAENDGQNANGQEVSKLPYYPPVLQIHGTIESLTQNSTGSGSDAPSPNGSD